MNASKDKKIIFSFLSGIVLLIALVWLLFRFFSAPLGPSVLTYHIGRDSTWYPVDLRGREKNMVGFSNDLMQVIAQDQGFRINVFEVGPNALFDGLNIGNYNAVLSSLAPNSVNKKRYGFSDPYYLVGPVLMTPADSTVASLKDMEGKILGIESGTLQALDIPESPNMVIIPYQTAAMALDNLDKNIIDGVILDALRGHVEANGFYKGRLKVATSPLTDRGLRVVTLNTPAAQKWIEQLNAGLASVKEKGIYDQLIKKWGLINTELKPPIKKEGE